jgi:hypothetical protein
MVKAIGRWFTGRIKEAGTHRLLYQVLSGSIGFSPRIRSDTGCCSCNHLHRRSGSGVIALISMALGVVIIIQGISLLPQFGRGA